MSKQQSSHSSPIVGIGASAGGLEALERFVQYLPEKTNAAYVIVQHLSPNFRSLMRELLGRHTKMPIKQIEKGMPIESNTIYLMPPRSLLTIAEGSFDLVDTHENSFTLPIDVFFKSLAEYGGINAVGIILSGAGSDGTQGVKAIEEAGGVVIVQTPESAGFDGMPRSAIATNKVDLVLPPEQMAARLLNYFKTYHIMNESDDPSKQIVSEENEMSLIFALLRRKFNVDFSFYKMTTILRRIERRLAFSDENSLTEYVRHLQDNEDELDRLYRDLIVEVTQFFRDEEGFKILAEKVIPDIIDDAKAGAVRVWIPGCATGEEAYSFAILFAEYLRTSRRKVEVKIFATDIHQSSLDKASHGSYTADRLNGIDPEYMERYFEPIGRDKFRVVQRLRKMVIFAPHNVTQDPPFTKVDLISCRNLLIYLRTGTQRKVLGYFHFGLRKDGILFLGPSEHIGELRSEFVAIDRRWRVFRKLRDARLTDVPSIQRLPSGTTKATLPNMSYAPPAIDSNWQNSLFDRFAPDAIVVDEHYNLVHILGNASRYLRVPSGRATLNLIKQLRGELLTAVRAALHRTEQEKQRVSYRGIRVQIDEHKLFLQISAEPFRPDEREKYYIVIIEKLEAPALPAEPFDVDASSAEHINVLERELQYTREHLQATIEELETTNEELQATNEELVASNEELQSTNEELHSVNEELYTVNSEYQQKITELLVLTDDMQNLQRSSQVCTLFLDINNRIRDFTPAAAEMFNLLPQDVGRPIEHLLYNLNIGIAELQQMTQKVCQNGETISYEITTPDEHYFLMRLLPYLSEDENLTGVVINMTDVTELKTAEQAVRSSERRYRAITDNLEQLICRYKRDSTLTFVNQTYADYFGRTAEVLIGTPFIDLLPKEDRTYALEVVHSLTPENPRREAEHRVKLSDGSYRWQQWIDQIIFDEDGDILEYQGVGTDITLRKEHEEAMERRAERLNNYIDNSDFISGLLTPNGAIIELNLVALDTLGAVTPDDLRTRLLVDMPNVVRSAAEKAWQAAMLQVQQHQTALITVPVKRDNKEALLITLRLLPVLDAAGKLIYIVLEGKL